MHLEEEKTDFLNVKKIYRLFVVIFIFVLPIYPQINLNGFSQITKLGSNTEAQTVISAYIDRDAESDFLISTSTKKLIIYLSGKKYSSKTVRIPYSISLLKRIKKLSINESEYGFVSRNEKIFGTFVLNSNGQVYGFKTLKFDYYPDNFVVSKNGRKAIIFGDNFNGLVFIDLDLAKKESLYFLDHHIVEDALFFDFDNDLSTDIFYYDILSESVNIIKNEINFRLTEIDLNKKVKGLSRFRKGDYNYDGFEDLLFSSERGIEIFHGDSVTNFQNNELLVKDYDIKDFQIGDFNRDGYSDFVYQTEDLINGNKLYAAFSSSAGLSKPYLLSGENEVISFDVFGWRKDKVIYLTGSGEIDIVSSIGELENTILQLGVKPRKIFSFRQKDNQLLNLAIIDSAESKLKLYINALSDYYEINLMNVYEKLEIEYLSNSKILFALYTEGTKLFAIHKLDLISGVVWSKQYYSSNRINQLKIRSSNDNLPKIEILSSSEGKYTIEEFEYRDFRYQKNEPRLILENAISATISNDNTVLYIQRNDTNIEFCEKSLNKNENIGSVIATNILSSSISEDKQNKIVELNLNGRKFRFASVLSDDKNTSYLLNDIIAIKLSYPINLDNLQLLSVSINSILEIVYVDKGKIVFSQLNAKTGQVQNTKEICDYKGPFIVEYVNRKNGYIFMVNTADDFVELKKIE